MISFQNGAGWIIHMYLVNQPICWPFAILFIPYLSVSVFACIYLYLCIQVYIYFHVYIKLSYQIILLKRVPNQSRQAECEPRFSGLVNLVLIYTPFCIKPFFHTLAGEFQHVTHLTYEFLIQMTRHHFWPLNGTWVGPWVSVFIKPKLCCLASDLHCLKITMTLVEAL